VKLTTQQLVSRPRKLGSIHPLPYTPSWRTAYLAKYRDSFTFTVPNFQYLLLRYYYFMKINIGVDNLIYCIDYSLDELETGVQFSVWVRECSLLHSIQNPAPFLGVKAALS
jgi:hypothetical protein